MIVVDPPPGRDDLEPRETRRFLARILFLPFYDALPEEELDRMAEVLVQFSEARAALDSGSCARTSVAGSA